MPSFANDHWENVLTTAFLNACIYGWDYYKKKGAIEQWREHVLPNLKRKQTNEFNTIIERASKLQDKMKFKCFIVKAYYGLLRDIHLLLDYQENVPEEERVANDNLLLTEVTKIMKFYLKTPAEAENDGELLSLPGGHNTKQFMLGFYNPIPSFMIESEKPWLYLELKMGNQTFQKWYRDDEKVCINV